MGKNTLYDYVERLSEVQRVSMRQSAAKYDLLPVQVQALHYLSLCNKFSDTPMGVTEYLGQTKGTVSQTLKVLERKGFLFKKPDASDKRLTHLELTNSGRKLLSQIIPPPNFTRAINILDDQQTTSFTTHISLLLTQLLQENKLKTFGICMTCEHNQKRDGTHFCALLNVKLSFDDTQRICREHVYDKV